MRAMADDTKPLTDEEREELEALRREKAQREEASRAAQERAELERLKREREKAQRDAEEDRRIREVRERNAKIMEPDDDLKMPLGQKIVLVGIIAVAVAIILVMNLGR